MRAPPRSSSLLTSSTQQIGCAPRSHTRCATVGDAQAEPVPHSPTLHCSPRAVRVACLPLIGLPAAQWLVDGEAHPPHGDAFQRWARRLEQRVPNVIITTTHSYAVQTRYAYACVACGQTYARHSRMDLRARCCGRCRGSLRLVSEPDAADPKRPPPPFAEFVRREYAPQRRRWPHVSHQRIMLALGRKWRRRPLKARS